jgi:hypothetical protein
MKLLATTCLIALLGGAAHAGVIQDLRTGLVPAGSYVTISGAVVTVVMDNSFVIAETETGPWRSIWVYAGETPVVAEGDEVEVHGTFIEHTGRDAVSLLHPAGAHVTVTGAAAPPDNQVTVAQLDADPEAWSSTRLFVTDGLIVQEVLDDGRWIVASYETGHLMILDDYFGLYPDVRVAECYNNADGVFFFYGGEYVLKALDLAHVDCTVPNEGLSFGAVKQMYR